MSGSQTFKNNSRRVRGGNWRRLRKCVGKCRWCDCRNPRRPNCDKTCQDQQRVLKTTYIPLRSRKIVLTQTNTSAPPAPDGEMKEPQCQCHDFCITTSVDKNDVIKCLGFQESAC